MPLVNLRTSGIESIDKRVKDDSGGETCYPE